MDIISVLLIGAALSMDAFAISVSNGIVQKKSKLFHAAVSAASFGLFQGIMPLLGWLIGSTFSRYIEAVDHWIAFALLGFIGVEMIVDAVKSGDKDPGSMSEFNLRYLFVTSVATSIDALIAGITFSLSGLTSVPQVLLSCGIIAAITFSFCTAGFYIGRAFGRLFEKSSQILGGVILIAIGLKILIEHLFF